MSLPIGKLPPALLARLLANAPPVDARVRVTAGLGLDCAVLTAGAPDVCLVLKSDPITFATDQPGWYLVHINANDLATSGATPRWLLVTLLLPEGATTPALVEALGEQVYAACRALGIVVIGGHTEITAGLTRPILCGTLIGEVAHQALVTPQGAQPGDRVLLTKGVPIEATALLAREFAPQLARRLSPEAIAQAQNYLFAPGLSIVRDARVAQQAGRVTAMHDPTEGGLAAALWELAEACGHALEIDLAAVPVPPLAAEVCAAFGLDPLAAIASGALLFTATAAEAPAIQAALIAADIPCAAIGHVAAGPAVVWAHAAAGRRLPRPDRDAVARLFETS